MTSAFLLALGIAITLPVQPHPPAEGPPPPVPVDLRALVEVIGMVEGGRWDSPGGALCFTAAAWAEETKLPYSLASMPTQARIIAMKRLSKFSARLVHANITPSPYLLGSAWRRGYAGALSKFIAGIPDDYAIRVQNLYEAY